MVPLFFQFYIKLHYIRGRKRNVVVGLLGEMVEVVENVVVE